MKTKYFVPVFLLAAAVAQGQTNTLTSLLQQGLLDEEANHNLNAAIADYQSLTIQFDKDRQVAATAVYRLGECYRILGRTNEAVSQYERMVREFPDEETLATLSRQNLIGLGRLGTPSQTAASPNPEATREWGLVKKLSAMSFDKVIAIAPTLLTDAKLTNLINQYNQCDLDQLRLSVDHGPQHPDFVKSVEIGDRLRNMIHERFDDISNALSMEVASYENTDTAVAPDEEDQEIQRFKVMIQGSPDLLNSPSQGKPPPLCNAAAAGRLNVVRFLLANGADINVNSDFGSPLECAVDAGQNAMVKLLLYNHADVRADSEKPLRSAVRLRYRIVAETLLAHGADPNPVQGAIDAPLLLAICGNDIPMVQLLLHAGANPNKEGFVKWINQPGGSIMLDWVCTPLYAAITMNEVPMAKLLLDSKADPNAQDKNGQMSLHYAAYWRRNENFFRLLLDYKANPNLKDKNGKTPFDWAANGVPPLPKTILDLLRPQ